MALNWETGTPLREVPLHATLAVMARKTFGLILAVALAFSWVAPLYARPAAPSHACCAGGEAPKSAPAQGDVPACCRASDALPTTVAVAISAPTPVLLSSDVVAAEPPRVQWAVPPRLVAASPQAPPGTHSGLSPPSFGL